MRKRIATAILVSVLIIGSLSGCGKAERDDIADSLYDLQDTASRTDGDEATAGGGIPEHLSYSVKTDDGTSINVEADVISSGFQNTQVYEAEVIEIDEDLIKKYADNLFDESKYEVIKPYNMFSMQELEEEESLIIEQMEGYSDNALPPACLEINLDEIGRCIENYAESNVAELAEGQLIYEKEAVHSNAFPFYSSKDDVSYVISGGCLVSEEVAFDGNAFPSSQAKENITYSSSRLRGLIDGEQWELFYEGIDGREAQQSIDIYSCESTVPYDLSTVRMDDKSVEKYGQNQSDFELSQKAAQDMLDKLGYENMELIDTGQRVFKDGGESWMNGYKFSFARSIESMQIGFNSDSIVMLGVPGDEGYHYGVQQEYIHVYVSDNSVYMLTIDNVVEIGDMLSAGEQNSLMSFDKIDSIARGLIEETWDYTDPLTIDNVCLKYLVLPFEEGRYALMPVWLYYGDYEGDYEENSWYKKSACICLNAVDGSEIHLSGPAVSTFWRAKSLID